ncbi:MAG: hypothetical protein ABFD50_12870 [Smithella sp.]
MFVDEKKVTFLALLLFVVFIIPVHAESIIRAKGMAAINKNFVDIACSKALDEAQRNAVEKAAGGMITSATIVENYLKFGGTKIYIVTAIDHDGLESEPSAELTVAAK